jgi:protein dpy-30
MPDHLKTSYRPEISNELAMTVQGAVGSSRGSSALNFSGEVEAASDGQSQTNEEELKAYLGDALVPILTYALDEVEKLRPPDPVLFLAHFLLRHNPRKTSQ